MIALFPGGGIQGYGLQKNTFITTTSLQLSRLTQSTSEQGNPGLVVLFISLFPSETPIFVGLLRGQTGAECLCRESATSICPAA